MNLSISDSDQKNILKSHFNLFYKILAESKSIPEAKFEKIKETFRCLSGIEMPYNNAIIGNLESDVDDFIQDQVHFFRKFKMPFVWYFDEDKEEFKVKLIQHGFHDGGTFQGVIGILKTSFLSFVPEDCVFEKVQDEKTMEEFNDLVCSTFAIQGLAKEFYKNILWEATSRNQPIMYHWIAKKEGQVVSVISTLIEDDKVSFWNGATLPAFRKQGLSTTLRKFALNDAISKGAKIGISYLMKEAFAFGICQKLGYEVKWRFSAFLSPSEL